MRLGGTRVFGGIAVALLALPALVLAASKLTENWKDVQKAMDEAKITPTKAVEAAEALSKGKAVAVTAAVKDKAVNFTVHTVAGGKCQAVTVDKAGKAGESKDPSAGACAGCGDSVKAMEAGKFSLASAIKAAEDHSKGKAFAASCETKAGNTETQVACAVGDKAVIVTVDKTGKATKMEDDKPAPKPGG